MSSSIVEASSKIVRRLKGWSTWIAWIIIVTGLAATYWAEKESIYSNWMRGSIALVWIEQSVVSLFKDAAVWVLLGPFIFRPYFQMAARAWDSQNPSSPDYQNVKIRENRFLVYYAVHTATFIVAWILFVVRYFPEALHLMYHLEGFPCFDVSLRDLFFGTIGIAVAVIGLAVFWMHPLFVDPEVLRAYQKHNLPTQSSNASAEVLGPVRPPPCNLTT
jgi:hypothetical protein